MPGHWKHEWIPLDFEAARSKNHGRNPKNWHAPGGVKVRHHHEGTPGDHRDASWIKLANWHDSTNTQTGHRHADLGKVADFSGTVREGHRSGTAWNSGSKEYNWRVFRQRTEREGPDQRGSHWSGDYASGTEPTMAKAKSAAQAAMKKHRARHIASGGDVGYGEPLPRGVARSDTQAVRVSELKYGRGSALWKYWTRGEGFAKWSGAAHKWTTLRELLVKAGVPLHSVDGLTTNIIMAAMPGYMKLAHAKAQQHKARRSGVLEVTERADTKKPYGDVPYGDPGYLDADGNQASKSGKPGVKRYPLTADKVQAAWSYINQGKNAGQYTAEQLKAIKGRIRAAMSHHGHEVSEPATASRNGRAELFRSYALEDYHIVRGGEGDASGRVVEAYMAVFGEPAEIRDHQGHYEEDIDRSAFNKRIADLERSRNGFKSAKVFYNHGMTIHGSPSDRYSMPVAVCEGIRTDTRGPITRSRYLDTPLGNEVLEMWLSGAVTAQSFTGAIIRSDPELRPGERYRPRGGQLPRVRRLELGLKEYGPTPFPAYAGAELVGVRMSPLGTWQAAGSDDGEIDEYDDVALPPDGEAAAGEPPDEEPHSTRYHQHALYVLRSKELRERAGLDW